MLAFERNRLPRSRTDDLLSIATSDFAARRCLDRFPFARLHLETRAEKRRRDGPRDQRRQDPYASKKPAAAGTRITIRDLFFNTPARKKFLRSESTNSPYRVACDHYAWRIRRCIRVALGDNALLVLRPWLAIASASTRFRTQTLDQLIPLGGGATTLERVGLPQPPRGGAAPETAAASPMQSDRWRPQSERKMRKPDRSVRATRFRRGALHGFGFQARDSEAQPPIRFYFCERTADSRSTHSAPITEAYRIFCRRRVSVVLLLWRCRLRGGCECAPVEDRGGFGSRR